MIIQPIVNIAEICAKHSINQAVVCPGSRNAPITLAFARHPKIKTFVIPDERSAGFIALGLAQSSDNPVVIVCTSGTAAANLYSAIIEAFYQQVPLLILTADRPPEWIDQQDGQAIRQQYIFQNHVLGSYQFPVSFDHEDAVWHAEKMVSEAIIKATNFSKGPIHINIPIREPFYPSSEEKFHYSENLKIIKLSELQRQLPEQSENELVKEIESFDKILIVVAQTRISDSLREYLNEIQLKFKWVIVGDITANIGSIDHPVTKHDIILDDAIDAKNLRCDLLITFGQSVLSKKLKSFLRNDKPTAHWHIGLNSEIQDPYKSLSKKIELSPEVFFKFLIGQTIPVSKTQNAYFNNWMGKEFQSRQFILDYFNTDMHSELHAINKIFLALPKRYYLHLANSMPIRYANLIGMKTKHENMVWANRGTSGIDGCTSAALGHAINSDCINVIITGDMAFFYDRNALWHKHVPDNLRIIILNNHGGGIFSLINGPKQLAECDEYFVTDQKLNAANTARDFGMKYFSVKTIEALPKYLAEFFDPKSGPSILEIETDQNINIEVFEDFKLKASQLWK